MSQISRIAMLNNGKRSCAWIAIIIILNVGIPDWMYLNILLKVTLIRCGKVTKLYKKYTELHLYLP